MKFVLGDYMNYDYDSTGGDFFLWENEQFLATGGDSSPPSQIGKTFLTVHITLAAWQLQLPLPKIIF